MFLQLHLEGSLHLSDVHTATATRNFIHDVGLLLDRGGVFDHGDLLMCMEDGPDVKLSADYSHVLAESSNIHDIAMRLVVALLLSLSGGGVF